MIVPMVIHKCDFCPYRGEYQAQGFRAIGVCLREKNLYEAQYAYKAVRCPYFAWKVTVLKVKENDKPEYVVPMNELMKIMDEIQEGKE